MQFLPDSRIKRSWYRRLYMVDSTTIGLFKEILKNAGRSPINGKRKGGIKVHALIKADEDVPMLVHMNAASSHDIPFIKGLRLPEGSIIVFDKGYNDYGQYRLWNQQKVSWITRLKRGSALQVIENNQLSEEHKGLGIRTDQKVILGYQYGKKNKRIETRLITYYDKQKDRTFQFITNDMRLNPYTITMIYKQRWQIEMLFKRIKQNYPLQYFLGDNENAIKVQIWCALIADLLLKIVQATLKRKWSFSNLSSMIRIHLMSYINLSEFMNNPDKALINYSLPSTRGPTLFE